MKKYIVTAVLIACGSASAQVTVGDTIGTAAVKNSVLLEFANTNDRGIILPYVRQYTNTVLPTEGSLMLDCSVPADARVKFYSGAWTDLSGQGADVSGILAVQPLAEERPESKTIIGAGTTAANDGVLVLEHNYKAMVLPQVDDVKNIPSPSPGMIVYVNKAGAKRFAVFNGSKWSFWKP